MKKKVLYIVLLILISFNGYCTRYYFNSDSVGVHAGNDSRSATQAQDSTTPWRTIAKLNSQFSSFFGADSILLRRGGIFYTTTGMIINKSGTSGMPIIISAYGTGNDPQITSLVKFTWTSVGANLWQSNETLSQGSVNCVTINGKISEMGRWPQPTASNGGYLTMTTPVSPTTFTQSASVSGQPAGLIGSQVRYRATGVFIEPGTITDYDPSSKLITFTPNGGSAQDDPVKNYGYFIEDNVNCLTYQNAWFYSKTSKWLRIYSVGMPTNVSGANSVNLLTSSNFSYITIDNINFNGSNSDIINISGGSRISFQNCMIQNAGRNGIKTGSSFTSVLFDSIFNCSSKGVTLPSGSSNAVIIGNTIRYMGQLAGMANGSIEDTHANHSGVGIYFTGSQSDGNADVENNDIRYCGYAGIHFKKQDNMVVNHNYVDTFCNVTQDGGGIYVYVGDDVVCSNRKITNNVVLYGIGNANGLPNSSDPGASVSAIYNDKTANNLIETGNTLGFCEKGIFTNYGCFAIVATNNTIYNNSSDGFQINTRNANRTYNLTITKNLIFVKNAGDFASIYVNHCVDDGTAKHYCVDGDPSKYGNFGRIDSNYYLKPVSPSALIQTQDSNNANFSLASWRTASPYDDHSTISAEPFIYANYTDQDDSTKFLFNPTPTPMPVTLSGKYQDYFGTISDGSITLQGYSSVILFLIGGAAPPTPTPTNNVIINGQIIIVR